MSDTTLSVRKYDTSLSISGRTNQKKHKLYRRLNSIYLTVAESTLFSCIILQNKSYARQ